MRRARRLLTVLAVTLVAAALCAAPALAATGRTLVLGGVDTKDYPKVALTLQVPAEVFSGDSQPVFSVKENGEDVELTVRSETIERETPTNVALVIDTSASMKGTALADAKAAAKKFVLAMGPRDRVTLVGFGAVPAVVVQPTGDKALLERGIDSLEAKGETALYDALVLSARTLRLLGGERSNIVVLSDGGDTVSMASLDVVLKELTAARIPVYAVGLETAESNTVPLDTVSRRSGGRLITVATSARLAGLFEGIARELADRYVVTFTSHEPVTKDVELDVVATAGEKKGTLATVIKNPMFEGGRTGLVVEDWRATGRAQPLFLIAASVLAFIAMALLAAGSLMLVLREPDAMEQLRFYDQLPDGEADDRSAEPGRVQAGIMSAVGYVAGKRGLTEYMHLKLERAGLPLRPVEYMYFHFIGVIVAGFLVQLLSGRMALSVLAVLLAAALPLMLLENAITRRRTAFENQLPDILDMLAGSLRAGWGIQQSIELVVHEMPPPASVEFKRVQTEARLGLSVEQALQKMAERLDSADFRWTVAAINIQRDVGGNLAEVLEIVSKTIRSRSELRRHISALTAEGRLSAWILLALPFLVFGVLVVVNPEYIGRLFTSAIGIFIFGLGLALLIVGAVWVTRVIKVEV